MRRRKKPAGLFDVDLKEAEARTFLLFVQTADAVLKYADTRLNQAGLSLVKHMVLQLLQAHGGTMKPSDIARLTMREKHDMTTLVRRLQAAQLVTVAKNATDRRATDITLTDKGRQAIIDVAPAARGIVKQVMTSVDDASLAALEETLRVLRQNAYDGLVKIKNRP